MEMTAMRVVGTGLLPDIEPEKIGSSTQPVKPHERRTVFLENIRSEVPVYRGATMRPGDEVIGPALIEERTTTVLIGTGDTLRVDEANNFMIRLKLEGK